MIETQLNRLVKPRIGKLSIYELKRSTCLREMLDEIADEHGPRMADLALAYARKAFNWYEVNGHDDDFKSPVVRGMARLKHSPTENGSACSLMTKSGTFGRRSTRDHRAGLLSAPM